MGIEQGSTDSYKRNFSLEFSPHSYFSSTIYKTFLFRLESTKDIDLVAKHFYMKKGNQVFICSRFQIISNFFD